MVTNLDDIEGSEDSSQILDIKFIFTDQSLSSYLTTNTKTFFKILSLPDVCLYQLVDIFNKSKEFTAAKRILMGLSVLNDTVERGV